MGNSPVTQPVSTPTSATPAAPATPDVFANAFAASQAGHPVSTDVQGSDPFTNAFRDSVAGRPVSLQSGTSAPTPDYLTKTEDLIGAGTKAVANAFTSPNTVIGNLHVAAPHVIQGSWLEKAIQKVDPSFQGSITSDEVNKFMSHVENPITSGQPDALAHPFVDVASSIDKQAHPVARAVAETAQSFLTPQSIATLGATGGAGLIDNANAIGQVSKLVSGGFSVAAIANAYRHLASFKTAFDAGDESEALYQLTQGILSGSLAAVTASHAAGNPMPGAGMSPAVRQILNPFLKSAATAAQTVGDVPQMIRPTAEVAGETFATRPVVSTKANELAGENAARNVAQGVSGAAGGLPVSQASSLRDIWEEPINAKTAEAKTYYKQLDDASNNAWTANDNALNNVRRDIRMKGGIDDELDAKLEAKKTALEAQQNEILAKLPEGTAAQARSLWEAKSRLEDLQDIFQKKSNVSGTRPEMVTPGVKLPPEQYNFKNIAKDLNAMDPDDLTKAVGSKSAAQDLVTSMNLAAKQAWTASKAYGAIKSILALTGAGKVLHFAP